jgi:hypothetical protein
MTDHREQLEEYRKTCVRMHADATAREEALVDELANTRAMLAEAHESADRWRQAADEAKAEAARAREDSGRHLMQRERVAERALMAEGELVGWRAAFDRLAKMLSPWEG